MPPAKHGVIFPERAGIKERQRLAEAEKPRQFLYRLHRTPSNTLTELLTKHNHRRQVLHADSLDVQDKLPTNHPKPAVYIVHSAYGNLKRSVPAFIRKWFSFPTADDDLPDALPP